MTNNLINYKKIENELERFEIISDYYRENPSRREPNESYLIEITDRLIEICFSEKDTPKNIEAKSTELLKFFGKKSRYI